MITISTYVIHDFYKIAAAEPDAAPAPEAKPTDMPSPLRRSDNLTLTNEIVQPALADSVPNPTEAHAVTHHSVNMRRSGKRLFAYQTIFDCLNQMFIGRI